MLWGAGFALYASGIFGSHDAASAGVTEPDVAPADAGLVPNKRSRARKGRGATDPATRYAATTHDDDLAGNGPRELQMGSEGGEAQLSANAIEHVFDGAMNRIRRCLVLVEGDEPVRGRLTFGVRIEPNGRVAAVNLSGPSSVTTGEAGDCLRTTVHSLDFPSFDGPPMVTHYPVTLE